MKQTYAFCLFLSSCSKRKFFVGAGVLLLLGSRTVNAQDRAPALPYSAPGIDLTNIIDPGVNGFVGPDGDGHTSPNNVVNPAFHAWASTIVDYSPAAGVSPEFANPSRALGPVTADHLDIVSLGELSASQISGGTVPGSITLSFDVLIRDGAGPDFAVFENGFVQAGTGKLLAEFAYVEVSSDGVNFARFPSDSRTPAAVGPFGVVAVEGVYNLAGKHVNNSESDGVSLGTPFDLASISGDPLVVAGTVKLNQIANVRLVDIPGNGTFVDAQGDPIYDAWPTIGSGGFDLEAVGVLNETAISAAAPSVWSMYR